MPLQKKKEEKDVVSRMLLYGISSSSYTSATVLEEGDGGGNDDGSITSSTTEGFFPSAEQPPTPPPHLSSDASSSSSDPDDNNNYPRDGSRRRKVRFVPNFVVRIIPNDRTVEEVHASWISMRDQYQNRREIRAQQYRLLEVPEYREAIQYVKCRLERHGQYHRYRSRRRRGPIDIDCLDIEDLTGSSTTEEEEDHCDDDDDLDDLNNSDDDDIQDTVLLALTLGDRRGLERAGLYASRSKALHARSIQEAYRRGMSDEHLAEICRKRSERALQWARACK